MTIRSTNLVEVIRIENHSIGFRREIKKVNILIILYISCYGVEEIDEKPSGDIASCTRRLFSRCTDLMVPLRWLIEGTYRSSSNTLIKREQRVLNSVQSGVRQV